MTRARGVLVRAALVLAACGLVLTIAPPAFAAKSVKIRFEYGLDRESWWWQHQQDEEITLPEQVPPPPDPVPPLSQRQRIPTTRPVPEDSLPVEVFNGEPQMISALAVDLATRGVTLGSEITNFVLTLEERPRGEEMPSIRAEEAKIEACRITETWAARYNDPRGNDGQLWETRPDYDQEACVAGKRKAAQGKKPPVWTFNLTALAEPWGSNPFENNGVMLVPAVPQEPGPADSWHLQFKIPERDDSETPDDEYKQTKDRLLVSLGFVPGETPVILPLPVLPASGVGTSSISPSTSFGGGTASFTTGGADPVEEVAAPEPAAAKVSQAGPSLPGYVWALLPVGLLALGAVRSVVMEPGGGTRPDGVIAAIRRRNLERRGAPLPAAGAPLSNAFAALGRGTRRTGRAVAGIAARVTRSVARR